MSDNQSLFAKARQIIHAAQRRRAMKTAATKVELERRSAEVELFLDDAASEGLNVDNPAHLSIIVRAWMQKQGYFDEPGNDELDGKLKDLGW